ncbi:hypothetical protein VTN96DRAFT_4197 [Rasamsonia emersonii]
MSSLSVRPEALSCVHRHAIGCLLVNSSICCRCADRRSVSELLPGLAHGDSHLNPVLSFNSSKYCRSCQEYWRAHSGNSVPEIPISQVLQSSVAAFNLPETTAEIEAYRAVRNRNSYQNHTRPRVQPRSSLSLHCRNITTLRHELEAINTDISRVLSTLHDLRREFPVSRVPYHHQRSMENRPDVIRDPSTSQNGNMPTLVDSQALPGPNQMGDLINLEDPPPQLQGNVDQSAVSQNMNTDTHPMATPGVDSRSNLGSQPMQTQQIHNQQMPLHLPQLPLVAVSIPGFVTEPAGHVNVNAGLNGNANVGATALRTTMATPMEFDQVWPGDGSHQPWLLDPQIASMRVPQGFGAAGTAALYASGLQRPARVQHPTRQVQPGAAASGLAPAFLPAFPVMSSAAPLSFSGQMQAQHVPDIVAANALSQVHQPRFPAHPYVIHPGGAASALGYQRQQHHPGLGLSLGLGSDGLGPSLNGPAPQNNAAGQTQSQPQHNSRRRARRPDDQGPNNLARRPSPPRFEGSGRYYSVPGMVLSANDLPPFPPVLTEPLRSNVPAPAASAGTLQGSYRPQGAVRNSNNSHLRAEHAAAEAMQMLNEQQPTTVSISHGASAGASAGASSSGRRSGNVNNTTNNNSTAAGDPMPTPRSQGLGLDDPRTKRPEPKEAEEMQVNLECKICMSQLVDTVLLPCGHAILCRWCAEQALPTLRSTGNGNGPSIAQTQSRSKAAATCPMCRRPVRQAWRIYLN